MAGYPTQEAATTKALTDPSASGDIHLVQTGDDATNMSWYRFIMGSTGFVTGLRDIGDML